MKETSASAFARLNGQQTLMIHANAPAAPTIDAATAPFLGQWHRLVSTTNWEKGRIIFEWRAALQAAAAPAAEYADEAWSGRVGGVSPQHVGRLRRVHERFATERGQFPGLFWSHFQAALDWDDAEMWLEGAKQSRWSVAEMRRQRAETLGTVADPEAAESEVATSPDEDFRPATAAAATDPGWATDLDEESATDGGSAAAARTSSSHEEQESDDYAEESAADESQPGDMSAVRTAPTVRLADLPDDVAEAFEAFKLAIIRHRLAGWADIAQSDVLDALDWLRQLALQEAE